jgi:hypothetical protein
VRGGSARTDLWRRAGKCHSDKQRRQWFIDTPAAIRDVRIRARTLRIAKLRYHAHRKNFVALPVCRIAMNLSERSLAGKCLCGRVQYRVHDAFRYALNCHCSQCRRATGSAFKAFAGIEREKLSITRGVDDLLIYGTAKAHDARCATCGSLLYSLVREARYVHVTLGTLIDTPSLKPTAHIFVGSKAAWHTIADDLPQHEEFGA